jgi:hypothetical protein
MQTSDNVVIDPAYELSKEDYDYFDLYKEMATMTLEGESKAVELPITKAEYDAIVSMEAVEVPFHRMSEMRRIMALMSPKNHQWRSLVVIDSGDPLDYQELGIYIRATRGYPYLDRELPVEGKLVHHNFDVGSIEAEKEQYIIPVELHKQYDIIVGVLHNAYVLALEAGDYEEGVEIPWYYIDWSILSVNASDLVTQLLVNCNHAGYSTTIEKLQPRTGLIHSNIPIVYPFLGRSALVDALAASPSSRRIYAYGGRIHTLQIYYDEGRVYSEIPSIYELMEKIATFLPSVLDGQLRPVEAGLYDIMGFSEALNCNHYDFDSAPGERAYNTRLLYVSPEEFTGIFVSDIVRANHANYLEVMLDTLGSTTYMALVGLMYNWSTIIAHNYYLEGMSTSVDKLEEDELSGLLADCGMVLKSCVSVYGRQNVVLERANEPTSLYDILMQPDNDEPLPPLTEEQEAEVYKNDEEYKRVIDYITNAMNIVEKQNNDE